MVRSGSGSLVVAVTEPCTFRCRPGVSKFASASWIRPITRQCAGFCDIFATNHPSSSSTGSSAVKIPLITGGGAGQLADLDWMAAHNVRVALQGHAPFSAAVQAVYNTLKALREGTKPSELIGIASPELMQKVTRAADYRQWTRDYLGGE